MSGGHGRAVETPFQILVSTVEGSGVPLAGAEVCAVHGRAVARGLRKAANRGARMSAWCNNKLPTLFGPGAKGRNAHNG